LVPEDHQRATPNALPAGDLIAVADAVDMPTVAAPMSATPEALDPDRPTQKIPKAKPGRNRPTDTITMAGVVVGADVAAGDVETGTGMDVAELLHSADLVDLISALSSNPSQGIPSLKPSAPMLSRPASDPE
jgi:hypothetical protein